MDNSENAFIARRKWFKQVSMPLIGASLAPELLGANGDAAEQSNSPSGNDRSLGARVYNVRDFGAKGDGATLDTVREHRDAIGATPVLSVASELRFTKEGVFPSPDGEGIQGWGETPLSLERDKGVGGLGEIKYRIAAASCATPRA